MQKMRFPFTGKGRPAQLLLIIAAVWGIQACNAPSTPLDAESRVRIDSISNSQIAKAQVHYDSLCKAAQVTELPHLIDSIKQVRLREIEAQLKTVPK